MSMVNLLGRRETPGPANHPKNHAPRWSFACCVSVAVPKPAPPPGAGPSGRAPAVSSYGGSGAAIPSPVSAAAGRGNGGSPMASPLRSTIVSSLTAKPRAWIDRLWVAVAERGRAHVEVPETTLAPLERARQLATALLSERGEASGAAVARELHAVLGDLGHDERLGFYRFLAAGFLPDEGRLRAAAEAYLAGPSPERAAQLAEAAEPSRQEVLRRMNLSPGGTAALVGMRKDVLARLRQEPALKPLDGDLRHLFASWFNRGFLDLRRIDWDTPAAVLEKLIEYEAVHEVEGWDDLRRGQGPPPIRRTCCCRCCGARIGGRMRSWSRRCAGRCCGSARSISPARPAAPGQPTRWRASISATAPGSSASTGSATSRAAASRSPSASW